MVNDIKHPNTMQITLEKKIIEPDDVIQHKEPFYRRVPTCDEEHQVNRAKLWDKPPSGGGHGERTEDGILKKWSSEHKKFGKHGS